MPGLPGFTLHDIARDQVPLAPVLATLTNQVDRFGTNHLRLHAAEPTCWEMTNDRPEQQIVETATLRELGDRYGSRFTLEPVRMCERCDDPGFVAHRRDVADVVTDTSAWRQLRFALFSAGRADAPSLSDLALVAQYLLQVRRSFATTCSTSTETFLRDRLRDSYVTARRLRDVAAARTSLAGQVRTGPWVAVGVTDLGQAWRSGTGRDYLAYCPGSIFDVPAVNEHALGPQVRAVLALAPDRASEWALANPGLVEVTDVEVTADQVPHLGLLTRLWAQSDPALDLPTAVRVGNGITCSASG